MKYAKFVGAMLALMFTAGAACAAEGFNADRSTLSFDALDMTKVADEDALTDDKGVGPYRFAVGHEVAASPVVAGVWSTKSDGSANWKFEVVTPDAAHLNFGFNPFHLPDGAVLKITSLDGKKSIGPFTEKDNSITGQLWTPVLLSDSAVLELSVPAGKQSEVQLDLIKIGHGYRGFGASAKHCKSGACNMDVACLGAGDAWNVPRRSVGAYTLSGTDTCTGSLLNNTANDRRMIFATAGHCNITSNSVAATIVTYWNYESPTCRTPGSAASGTVVPRPASTSSGATFLARTGATSTADFTLIEFVQPAVAAYNLYWAGWDRRDMTHTCAAPGDPASTVGLCASIHHPGVDEKRITFVQTDMAPSGYNGATGITHLHAFWDPTPPLLPGIQPPPMSVVPNVTEGGSSGSPLYNSTQHLVGVLSGGPSQCGSTGANLSDYYGRLAIAWEGGGTTTTAMKTHLDPVGGGTATTLDGIGQCTPPPPPTIGTATAVAANTIQTTWTDAPSVTKHQVFRALGTCASPGEFTQIAEVDNLSSYADTSVSGGLTYAYKVKGVSDEPCESVFSGCVQATATGVCALSPSFGGAISAASAGGALCGIDVNWNAATSNCGNQVSYNVYRSTTPNFTPSAANVVESCVSGTSVHDSAVTYATPYHYIVRAEDSSAPGSGTCNAHAEDSNILTRTATPSGPEAVSLADDVEGANPWTVTGDWAQVATQARSPTHSWFVPDPNAASDATLTTTAAIAVPNAAGTTLEFYLRYFTEAGYDGTRLEYSLNGGSTWTDILAAQGSVPANASRFISGGYNGAMNSGGAFPSAIAWHGDFNAAWTRSAVNLTDFAGLNVQFRFHFKSDSTVGRTGFFVDDIKLFYGSSCSADPPMFVDGFEGV